MRRWILAGLMAAAALALEAWLGGAGGQGAAAAGSAYEQLSAGNRTIARALVEAQVGQGRRLTLEEIASRRLGGETWSQVFRSLRARGLVRDRGAQLLQRPAVRNGATGEGVRGSRIGYSSFRR